MKPLFRAFATCPAGSCQARASASGKGCSSVVFVAERGLDGFRCADVLVHLSCFWQEPLHALLALLPLAWLVSTSVDVAERLPVSVHRVHQAPSARPQAIAAASLSRSALT